MTGVWFTTIYQTSTVYNDAEMEHTPYSDWSTCIVFDTAKPNMMHLTDWKLTTLAKVCIVCIV